MRVYHVNTYVTKMIAVEKLNLKTVQKTSGRGNRVLDSLPATIDP